MHKIIIEHLLSGQVGRDHHLQPNANFPGSISEYHSRGGECVVHKLGQIKIQVIGGIR